MQNMPRYYTAKFVLHCKIQVSEKLEKPNFEVIFSSGIINLLFDGLTYNTCGNFAHCSYFFRAPLGLGKILRNSQNIRAYYMLNHRIRCISSASRPLFSRLPYASHPPFFPVSPPLSPPLSNHPINLGRVES